jgi:hypothetical protein
MRCMGGKACRTAADAPNMYPPPATLVHFPLIPAKAGIQPTFQQPGATSVAMTVGFPVAGFAGPGNERVR